MNKTISLKKLLKKRDYQITLKRFDTGFFFKKN